MSNLALNKTIKKIQGRKAELAAITKKPSAPARGKTKKVAAKKEKPKKPVKQKNDKYRTLRAAMQKAGM